MSQRLDNKDAAYGKSFLERAYALNDTGTAKDLYDEWAGSYDADLNDQKYVSPRRTVEAIEANVRDSSKKHTILDAGCGTGLVGDCLAQSQLGKHMVLDGIDLSPGMLAIAQKKGIYRKLEAVDLSKKIALPDASYDIIACVGTLTKGHVGPAVLRDFVRLLVHDGLIAATIHGEVWEVGGYRQAVEDLKAAKEVYVISTDQFGIIEGQTDGAIMLLVRKL